jgi:N-acetylglucosaminyldiphosphoundecaprenol N-acetyl-beta-D-mannosaminyltransferase
MQEREYIKILKIRFNKTTLKAATSLICKWAKSDKKKFIATPNPEITLEAQKNHKYLKVLNHSDLNIADGTGIIWAAKYLNKTKNSGKIAKILTWIFSIPAVIFPTKKEKSILPERVTGIDLMKSICNEAQKKNIKIFLLGAEEGIAETARENLQNTYPAIQIVETHAGTPRAEDENEIIKKINSSEPDLLFVAYGAPKQEFWIHRNLKKLKTVKVAIGVGGAFDFIAGKRKRAPQWMQKTGTEWLFRLIQQPSRIKRIYKATIKFPLTILKTNLK